MKANHTRQAQQTNGRVPSMSMSTLMQTLSDSGVPMKKQPVREFRLDVDSDAPSLEPDHSSGSELFTPATESFDVITTADFRRPTHHTENAELLRIKQELAAAKSMISKQTLELAESRNLKHTMEQAMGPLSDSDFSYHPEISEPSTNNMQNTFNASARPFNGRSNAWTAQDEYHLGQPEPIAGPSYRGRNNYSNLQQPLAGSLNTALDQREIYPSYQAGRLNARGLDSNFASTTSHATNMAAAAGGQRVFSGPNTQSYGFEDRYGDDQPTFGQSTTSRRTASHFSRPSGGSGRGMNINTGLAQSSYAGLAPASLGPIGVTSAISYQPRPIGSPLTPALSDLSTASLPNLNAQWSPVSVHPCL